MYSNIFLWSKDLDVDLLTLNISKCAQYLFRFIDILLTGLNNEYQVRQLGIWRRGWLWVCRVGTWRANKDIFGAYNKPIKYIKSKTEIIIFFILLLSSGISIYDIVSSPLSEISWHEWQFIPDIFDKHMLYFLKKVCMYLIIWWPNNVWEL